MRKTGDVILADGSTLNSVLLLPSPIPISNQVWYPVTFFYGAQSGVTYNNANGSWWIFHSGADDKMSLDADLDDPSLPYDGVDLQFCVLMTLDGTPGGGDNVKFIIESRLLKLDGSETVNSASDEEVETTIDVSAWSGHELRLVPLNTITGISGAKLMKGMITRNSLSGDTFGNNVLVSSLFMRRA